MRYSLHSHYQHPSWKHIPKPKLRPAEAPFGQRPQPLPRVRPRSTSANMNWQQMLKRRMRSPGITPLQQPYHLRISLFSSLRNISLNRLSQRFIEALSIRPQAPKSKPHIPQIMYRHPADNNLNPLFPEAGDGTAKSEMLCWVFGGEERDLDEWYV